MKMANSIYQCTALICAACCLYLLAVSLKDYRLQAEQPFLSSRWIKVVLVGVAISQVWYLILPNESDGYWLLFNTSIAAGLVVMAFSYRKRYTRLKIEYQDHTAFLTIPTDRYHDDDGVALRCYKQGGEILVPSESKMMHIIDKYDLSKYVVIFFKIKAGAKFPDHIHPNREMTYLLTGAAEIIPDEHLLTPQMPFMVPPRKIHHFHAIKNCVGVSLIEK